MRLKYRIRSTMHGAVSIVNAIPTGKGSTVGISLDVNVTLDVTEGNGVSANIGDTDFINSIVNRIIPKDIIKDNHISIDIRSRIPMGYGLKSSSAVSNAIALACYKLLDIVDGYDYSMDAFRVINTAVDASIASKVSITGAFDDACACYFGGFFVTDNYARSIMRHESTDESLYAVILLPLGLQRRDPLRLKRISRYFSYAVDLALNGDYWDAMNLNGILVASALSIPYEYMLDVLDYAHAAGVSGNGPAIAAICTEDNAGEVISIWSNYGEVLKARLSNESAKVSVHEVS
jgi:shikimate kinase